MSKEKQIIEIKECIDAVYGADCAYYDVDGFAIANEIYNAGYRKQSEVDRAYQRGFERGKRDNVCGFSAEDIARKGEQLAIELEAMRMAANSYKTHYEQAKTEVERLQAEVDQLHALLECGVFANSVEDWQKFLNEKRADVAREIFEEIEDIIQDRKNEEIKRQGDNKMMSPFTYSFGVLEIIEHQYAELKKKYTEA